MNRHISAVSLVLAAVFISTSVLAEPVISPLRKSQPAPYSGVLFNPEAVAQVVAESEAAKQRTDAEVGRVTQASRAHCDRELSDTTARHRSDQVTADARLTSEKSQSALLKQQLDAQRKKPTAALVILSAAGGLLLGLITGVVVTR